jgi:hypothetical protein
MSNIFQICELDLTRIIRDRFAYFSCLFMVDQIGEGAFGYKGVLRNTVLYKKTLIIFVNLINI